jgi:hypothetical protein
MTTPNNAPSPVTHVTQTPAQKPSNATTPARQAANSATSRPSDAPKPAATREQQKQLEKQQKDQQKQEKQAEKQHEKEQKAAQKQKEQEQTKAAKLDKKQGKNSATLASTESRQPANPSHIAPAHKLPAGEVIAHNNGTKTIKDAAGHEFGVRKNGTISSFSGNGRVANFNSRGKVTSVRTANMDIRHQANGQRVVVSHRPDGRTLVSTGRHSGYVERSLVHNNHTYLQRTVIVNNRVVTHTFVEYPYAGFLLPHFVTPVFYSPSFYGWAYYPWVAPIHFTFGWSVAPWYVGPNPYFVASPAYPSASFWLADYAIGQTLAAAYEGHQEALAENAINDDAPEDADNSADATDDSTVRASITTPITPELKAAISEEIKEQITADNTAAADPDKAANFAELPTVLSERNHVFMAGNTLGVVTVDQQECTLQPGDVIQLTAPPATGSALAQLRVASSKITDCPAGAQVMVSVQDLQDMQNNLRTQIASGLDTLQKNQGKSGLPPAPAQTLAIPPRPSLSGIDMTPDADVVKELENQTQQADTLEQEITESALPSQNSQKN